jgi:hypothetical protein
MEAFGITDARARGADTALSGGRGGTVLEVGRGFLQLGAPRKRLTVSTERRENERCGACGTGGETMDTVHLSASPIEILWTLCLRPQERTGRHDRGRAALGARHERMAARQTAAAPRLRGVQKFLLTVGFIGVVSAFRPAIFGSSSRHVRDTESVAFGPGPRCCRPCYEEL